MIVLHVLEEPVEDRSWETEALYQGFLTVMARGGRVAVCAFGLSLMQLRVVCYAVVLATDAMLTFATCMSNSRGRGTGLYLKVVRSGSTMPSTSW